MTTTLLPARLAPARRLASRSSMSEVFVARPIFTPITLLAALIVADERAVRFGTVVNRVLKKLGVTV